VIKCLSCGTQFDVSDARSEYNTEFNDELDYDEDTGGEICANCGISETQSNIDLGRAIFMMNGDEDYDAEHVEKYL
jgi:hypothetical protein